MHSNVSRCRPKIYTLPRRPKNYLAPKQKKELFWLAMCQAWKKIRLDRLLNLQYSNTAFARSAQRTMEYDDLALHDTQGGQSTDVTAGLNIYGFTSCD